MESQNKTLRILIIKEVEGLFSFAGHEITKEQVIEIATLITDRYKDITEEKFKSFIRSCKTGVYGIIQKNPTSFMAQVRSEFAKIL